MKRLSKLVTNKSTILSDGAWGTNLQRKGLEIGECPEEWNLNYPDLVEEVAHDFIEAGSRLVKTNSFGGSRYKLEQYGLGERTSEINRRAGEISRRAAGPDILVMGSIGPTGKMLITGEVNEEGLYEAFKQQATALEEGGVDVILVETMSDLEEARLAVQAASANTECEIACTMTFEKTTDGDYKTMMGIAPADMFPTLIDAGASFIGTNCGNGMERMIEVVREIRAVNTELPVVVHANAGMPVYEEGKTIFPETPDDMASYVPQLVEAGANVIGGCCGTIPEHIRKIGEKLKG